MIIMVAASAIIIIAILALLPRVAARNWLIAAVLTFSIIDAVVTLWFDSTFNLKLYNAWYF